MSKAVYHAESTMEAAALLGEGGAAETDALAMIADDRLRP